MKQAFVLTCAAGFVVCVTAASTQHEVAVRHIDRAGALLFTEGAGNMQQGIASLLDAVAELTARTDAPAGVRTSVQTARQELVGGRAVADEKVSALLWNAYEALDGAKPFERPQSEDISDLLEQLKRQLASARSLAAAGNADGSARTLLAIALVIITPVQQ